MSKAKDKAQAAEDKAQAAEDKKAQSAQEGVTATSPVTRFQTGFGAVTHGGFKKVSFDADGKKVKTPVAKEDVPAQKVVNSDTHGSVFSRRDKNGALVKFGTKE